MTGFTLTVRVTPRGGRDKIEHVSQSDSGQIFLKVRVTAPPEDGRANAAIEALIAKAMGLAKSYVTITHGHKNRTKIIRVEGTEQHRQTLLGMGEE
jgi:uncharacterized protein (TIGR00251 family)